MEGRPIKIKKPLHFREEVSFAAIAFGMSTTAYIVQVRGIF